MLSLVNQAVKNLMVLYRINSITVKFDCEKKQLNLGYTRAGKPEAKSIPFSDIENLFSQGYSVKQPINSAGG